MSFTFVELFDQTYQESRRRAEPGGSWRLNCHIHSLDGTQQLNTSQLHVNLGTGPSGFFGLPTSTKPGVVERIHPGRA